MNSFLTLLSPTINVIVTGIFAGVVTRQYLSRHRLYQLYWATGLLMAFIATLAYVLMLLAHPTSSSGVLFFRVYYILGVLSPSWLGLGSIALVARPRATQTTFLLLTVLSVLTFVLILIATINIQLLGQIVGPGTGIVQPGLWLVLVIVLNTFGVVAVVGVAVYSGLKLLRRQSTIAGFRTSTILWANIFILVGDLINAAAGSLARVLGIESGFWVIMAFGWVIFFIGVLLASRRSRPAKPASTTRDLEDAEKRLASS